MNSYDQFPKDLKDALTSLSSEVLNFTETNHTSPIPELSFYNQSYPSQSKHCVYSLGISIILQGQKEVTIGDQVYQCHEGQSLLTTMDLPVSSHIVQASAQKPFLAILLLLDLQTVNQVVADMPPETFSAPDFDRLSFSVESADASLIGVFLRLVRILEDQRLSPHLIPLIKKEIIVRLLNGPHGIYLRQLVRQGSANQKIHHVVNWLKQNYAQAIPMGDLADKAAMSQSTFRQHFRDVVGMSPLQYQKQLRLQKARYLMFNENVDVGQAARLVGYESASQFSREYSRLFAESPQRDIQRMRKI